MESTYSGLFLLGIGVVEAQIGFAAELVGEAKINADGLGVADVQIAVGLGWKAGLDLGVAELFGAHILGDDVAEEVGGGASFGTRGVGAFRDSCCSWLSFIIPRDGTPHRNLPLRMVLQLYSAGLGHPPSV